MKADVTIIGAGIVGLSTAYHLCKSHPEMKVLVLEKESEVAFHQSGRNSGVIHSGIYYKPGSLKARFCRKARQRLAEFCKEHSIPYEMCGKIILATEESEHNAFENLLTRAKENQIRCRELSDTERREREPFSREGRAMLVEDAGIVDYPAVCRKFAELISLGGGFLLHNAQLLEVHQTPHSLHLVTTSGNIETGKLINCAGLYSDRIAAACGVTPSIQIIPFRGEYYTLVPEAPLFCRHLIYPVPDPSFPFLGVHLTRIIGGVIECGPNAVLALAREGYDWKTIHFSEFLETLLFRGFQRVALQHWRTGIGEVLRSISKKRFCLSLQKLTPDISPEHLTPAGAGIRAQAVDRTGCLVDDFVIEEGERSIHVLNAPSPAATSALEIGRYIVEERL